MEAIAVKASLTTLRIAYPTLAKEVSLLRKLLEQACATQSEFVIMTSFLKDADKDEKHGNLVKAWVEEVRDAAYDVEDIIDKFIYQFHKIKTHGFSRFLHRTIFFPIDIIIRHQTVTRMQRVTRRVQSIMASRNHYLMDQTQPGTRSVDALETYRQAEYGLLVEDEEIVGIEENVDSLVNLLVDGNTGRMVISVTGMGGLGKTTFVAKVYQNEIVQKSFNCHTFLTISQPANIEEILRNLIKQFKIDLEDMKSMKKAELLGEVNRHLKSESYIVVLDDVWNIQVWDELQRGFPSCLHRSRIILTTRNAQVASSLGGASYPFLLETLKHKDAQDLFYKNAFCKSPCPPELEHLALMFVERCEGLPLAIVSVGRLLASTPHDRWERVYNSLNWELTNNDMLKRLNSIILLSFYDLPYYLQKCFLYFSIFPEDQIIHRKRLIRLWIAEGFVEPKDGLTLEQVAEDYLIELINRSMIQIVDTNEFGRVKTCRIHDVKREIALGKSKEMRFNMVYRGEPEASFDAKIRRLSICEGGESFQANEGMKHLRSFHVFDENMPSSSLQAMFSRFKWLRVLDLQDTSIESIPDALTNLFLLRYLNLKGTKVKKLPKSLGRLTYLQTLDVRDTEMEKLPNGIVKLQKLRHLYFYRKRACYYECFSYLDSIHVPNGICQLKDLRSVSIVEGKKEMIRELGNLTKLRRLGIHKLRATDGENLCNSLGKMKNLQNLTIRSTDENDSIRLDLLCPDSPCLLPLQELGLHGNLENPPQWFRPDSLKNLTHLRLHYSQLEEDLLSSLQHLPQLVFLVLFKAYNGDQLGFQNGSFPKLKKLYLHTLSRLKKVHIEAGAIESIQELNLIHCSELKMLPEGIEHLHLQKLYLVNMPEQLIERMRIDGEDRERIKKITYVKHAYQRGGDTFFERLS